MGVLPVVPLPQVRPRSSPEPQLPVVHPPCLRPRRKESPYIRVRSGMDPGPYDQVPPTDGSERPGGRRGREEKEKRTRSGSQRQCLFDVFPKGEGCGRSQVEMLHHEVGVVHSGPQKRCLEGIAITGCRRIPTLRRTYGSGHTSRKMGMLLRPYTHDNFLFLSGSKSFRCVTIYFRSKFRSEGRNLVVT